MPTQTHITGTAFGSDLPIPSPSSCRCRQNVALSPRVLSERLLRTGGRVGRGGRPPGRKLPSIVSAAPQFSGRRRHRGAGADCPSGRPARWRGSVRRSRQRMACRWLGGGAAARRHAMTHPGRSLRGQYLTRQCLRFPRAEYRHERYCGRNAPTPAHLGSPPTHSGCGEVPALESGGDS